MIKLKFTVPIKPFGKQRPYYSTTQRKVFTPEKTKTYEDIIRMAYISQCKKYRFPDDVPIIMSITAIFPIPKSTSKKKREQMLNREILPIVKPDTDNVGKIIADSLNKIAYKDDSHITTMVVSKIYGEEPKIIVRMYNALEYLKNNGKEVL